MSAEDWEFCPRCRDRAFAARDALRSAAQNAYGKVDSVEWANRMAEADKEIELTETFREDYEFYGVKDGVLSVRYSGYCSKCDLSLNISEDHPFYEKDLA